MKEKVMKFQQELSKSSLKLSENLGEDLTSVVAGANQRNITPSMRVFFGRTAELYIYIKCSSWGIRYHLIITGFCLSLAVKSVLAYDGLGHDEKSGTGILILPSRHCLKGYKNYIRPERGFNINISKLKNKIKNYLHK